MPLHVYFNTGQGQTLEFAIKERATGYYYDFSTTSTTPTFTATPVTKWESLPASPATDEVGLYETILTPTPTTSWNNDQYVIIVSNGTVVQGIAGAVMFDGDDGPVFPSGSGGVDPLSENVPGTYASGTAGSAIGEIPSLGTQLSSIQTDLATLQTTVNAIPTAISPAPIPIDSSVLVIPSPGYNLEAAQGTDRSWMLTLYDTMGAAITGLTQQDVLSATVWAGSNQPSLVTPTVVWASPSNAQITLSLTAAQTSSLLPAIYRVRVTVAPYATGLTLDVFDSNLRILASSGAAILPPVYCQLSDLILYCPAIESLQDRDDLSGFVAQRSRARSWFEDLIQRHYRNSGGISRQQNLFIGGGGKNGYRTGRRSPWLTDALAANQIVLTDDILEANARYALGLICEAQIGVDNPYRSKAARFYQQAETVASMTTVELDTDNDGLTDVVIDLGCADTLRG